MLDAHARVIGEQDGAGFKKQIESIRTLTQRLRDRYASADEKKLLKKLRDMSTSDLREVARAFTLLFWLLNLAEERHAANLRSADDTDPLRSLFKRTKKAGLGAEQIALAIEGLRATIVLTAHPTEALRWSLRETLDRIAGLFDQRASTTDSEREEVEVEEALFLSAATSSACAALNPARSPPLDSEANRSA